jgi:hypothetical protein
MLRFEDLPGNNQSSTPAFESKIGEPMITSSPSHPSKSEIKSNEKSSNLSSVSSSSGNSRALGGSCQKCGQQIGMPSDCSVRQLNQRYAQVCSERDEMRRIIEALKAKLIEFRAQNASNVDVAQAEIYRLQVFGIGLRWSHYFNFVFLLSTIADGSCIISGIFSIRSAGTAAC